MMQTIDKLDKPTKQQLAGELEKNITATPEPTASETPPAGNTAAPADATADKGFGFDGHTGKPFASQQERDTWFKSNNKVDPKAAGNTTTPPAGTSASTPTSQGVEIDPAKVAADKAAKNQADADQRNADIEKTKQANAAKNQQDAAIKAAADAAKAKPAFQQTASDKLAIKQAADKGIREAKEKKTKLKKKKIVAEFKSKFLGMMI
jgi:hypothetical protein